MKEKMETLIFAIIASYNAQQHQKFGVTEPEKFQPFDLQALKIPQTTCETDSAGRLEAFASQRHEFIVEANSSSQASGSFHQTTAG
jgi:hypothetical protein